MWVKAPTESDESAIRQLEEIILDELNVKRLELAPSESEFVSYSIRPNLPVLGPKYGRSVPQVRAALEALPPAEVAGRVAAGESIELILDGRTVSLSPEEVLVSAREREGYAAMSAAGYLVVLDAHLTRDLVYEGLSRQVVRRLNDWRRSAGFTIEDRVAVRYQASSELAEAIKEFKQYIKQETLATSLEESPLDGAGFQGEAEFGEQWLQVALTRSTAANR
jgi:isoleucyl-tRNA synthetase